jgi:cellulose synthase/poly-beta-1,6-N-acetylglucosamine synthase-like glycosyltransferase
MSLWVALAVAAGIAIFLVKSRVNYLRLPNLPASNRTAPLDMTVIIPARNERGTIGRAVRSFDVVRVVVVDDASSDGTAEAARNAGAEVLTAPPLPAGHLGKPNACQAGARIAKTKWLLFVDADTEYAPEFAPSIVEYAERESLDIATAFLYQRMETAHEKIILPYAFALYFCGVSAANVNSSRSREALANGQCLLIRRTSYEVIGGHGAVAESVIEDVALAVLAKSRSLRLRVIRAEHLGAVRMYDSFTAIRRGFEKNSFRFLGANPRTGIQVIVASVLLTSYAPVLGWLISESRFLAATAFALTPSALLAPWYGSIVRALAAPIAIYSFQAIAISAMIRNLIGTKTKWKDRDV